MVLNYDHHSIITISVLQTIIIFPMVLFWVADYLHMRRSSMV